MKDLFRIVRHRFLKNNKKAVSTLAIIITFVMVYTLIMPAVALERKAAENEPGIALEETVSGDAMAEAEPESLEAEEVQAEESESDAEAVAAEESAEEEIETESDVPAAAPEAEDSAVNSGSDTTDTSAAVQITDAAADQGSFQSTDAANKFDGNQSAADSSADPSVSDANNTDAEEGMPAQKFEQIVKFNEIIDEEGNTVEKQVKVKVDAEKDAFPAGAVMKAEVVLTNIDPQRLQDMEDAVEAAVKKAAGESGLNADNTRVVQYQAIDINFFNKEGQKIQPAKKVEVRITSDKIREIENPVLVHVNENDKTGEIKNADVIEKKDVSIIDEQPDTIDNNENTMLFKASRFSPFVIVENEIVGENGDVIKGLPGAYGNGTVDSSVVDGSGVLMTSEGDYNVTVTYDANANIPANAELQVNEITEASRAYQNYMEEAKDVLEGDAASINYAKIFDVDIVSDGEVVTPEAEVDVDIAYKNSDEIEEGTVVQALQFGEGTPAVNDDAFVYGDETHIDGVQMKAVEIPVTAIVGTELHKEITLTTPDGENATYVVSVTYGSDAKIPDDAQISVTEYDADSEEYLAARDAIVAEKKADDPSFNEARMGMSALDISLVVPGEGKVEPQAPVKVEINMKSLPEEADVETLKTSMELQHLKVTGDDEIQLENVANTFSNYNDYDGNITVNESSVMATFNVDSFSTFSFIWTDDTLHENVIVHYVDTSGKEIQGTQRQDVTVSGNNAIAFSSYQGGITNYRFKEARLDSMTGPIVTGFTPQGSSNRLRFTNGSTTVRDVERPYNVEVYYIYSPQDNPDGGDGTPSTLNAPKTNKTLERQGDGTYDITLSIAGEAESTTTTTKANVIVIYDTSRSMLETETTSTYTESSDGMWGKVGDDYVELQNRTIWKMNGEPYNNYRYKAGTGNNYSYGVYNRDVIPLYYNNGTWYRTRTGWGGYWGYNYSNPYNGTRYARVENNSNDTSYNLGFDASSGSMVQLTNESALVYNSGTTYNPIYTEYTGPRYTQTTTTMSKHDIAKDATSKLAAKLLGMNNKDGNPSDMVEMALIEFDSIAYRENGANITNPGAKTSSLTTFNGWVDNIRIPNAGNNRGGTNWEDALDYANAYNFNDNDPVYIIFVSDGNPTFRTSANGHSDRYGSVSAGGRNNVDVYGQGNGDTTNYCLDAAVVEAKGILASNKQLYTVGAFLTSNSKMANLGGHDYDASDSEKLTQAFDDIVDSITNALNIANVKISDGITGMTANTFVSGDIDPSSFRYTKGGQPWSPITEGADRADVVIDEDGNQTVQWNMGENYLLEKNVTYTVTFTVWPKQAAYDILADLNNGIKYYTYADYVATSPDPQLSEEDAISQGIVIDSNTRSQIIRNGNTYTVLTNTKAEATYQVVTFVDGEETGRTDGSVPIANPTNGMGLDESHLDVRKDWDVSLDPKQLLNFLTENPDFEVLLHILNDQNEYVPVTIKPNLTYADDGETVIGATWPTAKVYIAPGVMLSESHAIAKSINPENYTNVTYGGTTYVVLESGHDYTIDEKSSDWHFELEAKTYHPMVVDGEPKDVTFKYSDGEITGIEAIDTTNVGTIVATNKLRSGVNIVKKVTEDEAGTKVVEDDSTFYVKLTARDKTGKEIKYTDYLRPEDYGIQSIISSEYTGGYYLIRAVSTTGGTYWYYSLNPDGSEQIDPNAYPIWFNDYQSYTETDGRIEGEGNWDYDAMWESGEVKPIKQGQLLQLKNVPYGTTISITEVKPVRDNQGNITGYVDVAVGESFDGYKLLRIDGGDITADYNTSYNIKVYNRRFEKDIVFRKADISEKGKEDIQILDGAQFELIKGGSKIFFDEDNNVLTQKQVEVIIAPKKLTDNDIDTVLAQKGIKKTISIGETTVKGLTYGEYILKEVQTPAGYIVMTSDLTLTIGDELSSTSEYISVDNGDEDNSPSVTIFNVTGQALPNTGGFGTLPYTLGGFALMMASALMYGFRMRRRERRLN